MRSAAILPLRGRVLMAALLALVCSSSLTACIKLPNLEESLAKAKDVPETSKVYASDGTFITQLHAEENRENIPLSAVPQVMRDATIAIEDERFYDHPGVDVRAILRAFFRNTNQGKVVEGGSTITQQYVKNVLVQRTKTLKRKINEAALAYQLEQKYSKDQILELYLNTVYFGQGAYGIETAAKTFFGISARALTLPQASLLAGLIKSPARYDPFVDLKATLQRRVLVLSRMQGLGLITPEDAQKAAATPPALKRQEKLERYEAAYFVEWVKQLIQYDPRFKALGSGLGDRINSLFKGGLRIYTTVDLRMQKAAEGSSRSVLDRKNDPYNGMVSVDPDTGGVKAMVGGRDFFNASDPYAKFNLATQSKRQPGSAFKPFTLVAALERGISLNKSYRGGSQVSISLGGGEVWRPRNYDSMSFGSSLTVREATIKSVNVVYAQMVRDVGPESVVEVAKRLGITSELKPFMSIALGAQEVSPLELSIAYSAFANGGYRVNPHGITKITDSTGKVLYDWKPTKTEVLKPRIVQKVTDALEDVVKFGTGRRQRLTGRPTAGKTGTSDEYHDAWFAGYTRQLVAVNWVGFPKAQIPMYPPYTRIRVVGGSWPGKIWKEFMEAALSGAPSLPFDARPIDGDLVRVAIDVTRNCLPNKFTPPNLIERVEFAKGEAPTQICTEPSSPVRVIVPRVLGRAEGDARSILERAGLLVRTADGSCPGTPGTVCAQFPAAGSSSTAGETVTITLSQEQASVVVPNVLGLSRTQAVSQLRAAGLTVDYVFVRNGEQSPAGCKAGNAKKSDTVWAQTRCGGETAARDAPILIYVNPIT